MFMNVKESLFEKLEAKKEEMVQHRRYLHQHPELSFQETETAAYIQDFYKNKDVTITQPVEGSNAIIVEITG